MSQPTELFNQLVNGTIEKADQLIKQNKEPMLQGIEKKPTQDIMLFVNLVQKKLN